jgi:predicted phosphodiesterase
MLKELKDLCAEEGVDPVFLSGNHDPGWPGPGWVGLADGQIIVTHGDALLFGGSPWKREILVSHERVVEIWDQHPNAGSEIAERIQVAREIARDLCSVEYPLGRRFVDRAWDAMIPPQRAVTMLEAWRTQGTAGAEFCRRYFPNAQALVIGHFHREGCWLRDGRRVINTGSFTSPGPAHWVEWNDGWLSRGIIHETPGICHKGRTLDVWRW